MTCPTCGPCLCHEEDAPMGRFPRGVGEAVLEVDLLA